VLDELSGIRVIKVDGVKAVERSGVVKDVRGAKVGKDSVVCGRVDSYESILIG
jgi:hypothetical protein